MLQFFAFFALLHTVHSVVVECKDHQAACICPSGAAVCKFSLRIDTHLTGVSYRIGPDGRLMKGGTQYILNSTVGFLPLTLSVAGNTPVPCLFEGASLVSDEDFTSRNCSVPITVDGDTHRPLLTYNGRVPGPTLVVDHGATIYVRVSNNLKSETTSVHWHGMHQHHTHWMDGVGRVAQKSIPPEQSFDYIFEASPKGTHWYHFHVGSQRSDGLFGGLVVRDDGPISSNEVVPEEDESTIIVDQPELLTLTLFDLQSLPSSELHILADVRLFQVPFHSGLINGRGRFQSDTVTPLSVFTVTAGRYYRFRVIGAQSNRALLFSVDGHRLRVIASDGQDICPMDVDYISAETGERYDFLVHTNATPGNYWIRGGSVTSFDENQQSARAILAYEGAESLDWRNGYSNVPESGSTSSRCTADRPCKVLNCPFRNYSVDTNRTCVSLLDLRPCPAKPPAERPTYQPSKTACTSSTLDLKC